MENILDYCTISGESVKKFEGIKKYIATGDVIENKIINSSEVDYMNKPSRANQIAKEGDVIFAKMKDTKKVIKIDKENSKYIYSTGFYIIKPNEGILTDYIYWVFNSIKFNRDKDKHCKGATQKALNSEGLRKIKINKIPNLEEQQKIVSKLNKIYEIMNKKKKQLMMLDELIKSQFVEMFGDIKIKEKVKNISVYFSRGKTPNYVEKSNIKVISQACIYWDEFKYEKAKYQDENKALKSLEKMIENGDVLITSTGTGTLGRCNVYYGEDHKYMADSHVSILRLNYKEVNPIFFKYYFMQEKVQKKLYAECVNGSTNQIELSKDRFLNFRILSPEITLQNQFSEIVKQIDKQKFEIEKSLKETQELYESLMEKYFG